METKLPARRHCLAHLTPQTFAVLELSKWLGQGKVVFQATVCKANREADTLPPTEN